MVDGDVPVPVFNDPEASFPITLDDVGRFVTDRYGDRYGGAVEPAGAGSWSRCFGFRLDGAERIIKVSPQLEDLELDRVASTFARPGLPVPQVVDHGDGFDMHFTVADRIPGHPLETCTAEEWVDVVPSVADALDTMRTSFATLGSGWGGWDASGTGRYDGWRSYLAASLVDVPGSRVSGWLAKLDTRPHLRSTFDAACEFIDRVASDDVPRALLHCDLLYRNAHVNERRLAGVFDWGCSLYGDPLYELSWFEFWAPWYPQIDTSLVVRAMAGRSPDTDVARHLDRWLVALLHNGATHLAYQAFIEDWPNVELTAARLHTLAASLGHPLA